MLHTTGNSAQLQIAVKFKLELHLFWGLESLECSRWIWSTLIRDEWSERDHRNEMYKDLEDVRKSTKNLFIALVSFSFYLFHYGIFSQVKFLASARDSGTLFTPRLGQEPHTSTGGGDLAQPADVQTCFLTTDCYKQNSPLTLSYLVKDGLKWNFIFALEILLTVFFSFFLFLCVIICLKPTQKCWKSNQKTSRFIVLRKIIFAECCADPFWWRFIIRGSCVAF